MANLVDRILSKTSGRRRIERKEKRVPVTPNFSKGQLKVPLPHAKDGLADTMHPVQPSPDAASRRMIFDRLGNFAKGSFLLSILSSESASPSERAMAFRRLMDNLDNFLASLSRDDYAQLRECFEEAAQRLASNAVTALTLEPGDSLVDDALIDGKLVKRVVVPPAAGTERGVDVVRAKLPSGRCYMFTTEYTFDSDDRAVLDVVDRISGRVLGAVDLQKGHNRFATMMVAVQAPFGNARVVIRVMNSSAHQPLLWYRTTIQEVRDPHDNISVVEAFAAELRKRRSPKARPVLQPMTEEPLTLADIDRLTTLRNKFSNQRIFIMGNGPSLNRTPLELLKNDCVFGLNRVSLLFDRISWRPTFFTAYDVRVVPDNQQEFADIDIPYKFFSARYKRLLGEKDSHYWHHTKGFYEGFESCFEPTVVYSGFGGGGTVAVIAIELAFFMGFREIYLIGTDVSYSVPSSVIQTGEDAFGDGVKLKLQSTQDDDRNHFDPRYFGRDKKWHNPNVRDMKIGFARAASYIERRGGALYNATVGGELNEVPRVDFESLF